MGSFQGAGKQQVGRNLFRGWALSEGETTFPPVLEEKPGITLEAIAVDSVRGVDDVEEDVIEEGLEGGDGGALSGEEGRECVGSGDT